MWDKFDALRNTERNKQLIAIIKTEKDTVQAVQRTYNVNWGNEFVEPNLEMVSYGALVRCCTCLESMLLLARNGYIGSANALLRQVYESLVWAKMTIDTDDERILFQLHDGFYENTMRDRTFVSFLNRIAYQTDGSGLTSEAIISEGKSYTVIMLLLLMQVGYHSRCQLKQLSLQIVLKHFWVRWRFGLTACLV